MDKPDELSTCQSRAVAEKPTRSLRHDRGGSSRPGYPGRVDGVIFCLISPAKPGVRGTDRRPRRGGRYLFQFRYSRARQPPGVRHASACDRAERVSPAAGATAENRIRATILRQWRIHLPGSTRTHRRFLAAGRHLLQVAAAGAAPAPNR